MGELEWGVGVRNERLEGPVTFDKSTYRIKLHLLAEQERFAAGGARKDFRSAKEGRDFGSLDGGA